MSVSPTAPCNRSSASRFPSTFRQALAHSNVWWQPLLHIRTCRCRRRPSRSGNFHRPHSTSRSDRSIVSGFCRSGLRSAAVGHESAEAVVGVAEIWRDPKKTKPAACPSVCAGSAAGRIHADTSSIRANSRPLPWQQ